MAKHEKIFQEGNTGGMPIAKTKYLANAILQNKNSAICNARIVTCKLVDNG